MSPVLGDEYLTCCTTREVLTVVLICISLMAKDTKHLLYAFLAVIFFEVSVQTFCPLANWVMCILIVCRSPLLILNVRPLSDKSIINTF